MIAPVSRAFFHSLARNRILGKATRRYGLAGRVGVTGRFIAGESIEDAVITARALEARGMGTSLGYLSESVTTLAEAASVTRAYLETIDTAIQAGIGPQLSLRMTQLGFDVDPASSVDNIRRILRVAERHGIFVTIEMEEAGRASATLGVFETLWQQGYRNVGTVLQAALPRSEADLGRLLGLGASVRIVKGGYRESGRVAYRSRAAVRAAFLRLATTALAEGTSPAIATHDEAIVGEIRRLAARDGITPDRFEFQMLYGTRPNLQAELAEAGYQVRIYVPFGPGWFPHVMRRLGDRPGGVWFVLGGLLRNP